MDELDFLDLEAVDELDAEDEEAGVVHDEDQLSLKRSLTHVYPDSLPYACETQAEFEERVAYVMGKLVDCVSLEDFDVSIFRWNQYLQCLLSLKYPLPRAWRAELARFYYELAVMPALDARLAEMAGSMCIRLLRPKRELDACDLQLPWRPLYDALSREIFHKARKVPSNGRTNVLLDVAEYAQRFFPASDAEAMLQTVLPLMDGSDLNSVIATQALLVHFLPLDEPQCWLPALFRLWETFKSSLFDDQMLDHLARLAKHQLAEPHAVERGVRPRLWQETGLFTDAQFAMIMTKCLRSAGLPVGVNQAANATLMAQSASVRTGADALATSRTLQVKKPSDRLRSFAVLLVYSMAPDASETDAVAGCKALDQLAKFVQATESYFHPSNWGVWQVQLASFLQHLTWEFACRCKEETRRDCTVPRAVRLTPAIQAAFVRTLRPVCLVSMFSKDPLTILGAQTSLKRMAYLEPALILPAVLERAYTSLETLETTHRTTSVISALAALAQPLVARHLYAAGAKHLVSLLHLCLPGIDLNDPMKTVSTCVFVLSASLTTRLGDYSESDGDEDPTPCALDDETQSTLGAENDALRFASADLDAWVLAFVGRILHLIDNLPDEGKGGKIGEKNEEMVLNTLMSTCDVFCSALSPALFVRALDALLDYGRTTVSASGVRVIGSLIGCFARADSSAVLARVVPLCCPRIEAELAHGASATRTTSTSTPLERDTALHWHISLLHGALMFAGAHVLHYRDELLAICKLLVARCYTERGYMLTAKLVQRLLFSLGSVYPNEQRCVNGEVWHASSFAGDAYRSWGTLYPFARVRIDWHTPSDAEIAMALDVLHEVVAPALRTLEHLLACEVRDAVWHNDVCRHLLLVRFAYAALAALFAPCDAAPTELVPFPSDLGDACAAFLPERIALATGCAVPQSDPRHAPFAAFHAALGDWLLRAATDLHTRGAEDQIDAAKLLVRALRTYLVQAGYNPDELRGLAKSVAFFGTVGRTWPKQQAFPRIFWVRRAALYHLSRVRVRAAFAPRTPRTDALTLQLLRLCTANYVAIRKVAQTTLASVFAAYDGTRALCLDSLLHIVRTGDEDPVKGALYVLANKGYARTAARNARCTRPFFLTLLHAEHAKPSIQKLVRSLLSDAVNHMREPAVRTAFFPTDALRAAAAALAHRATEQGAPRTSPAVLEAARGVRAARLATTYAEHAALQDAVSTRALDLHAHWAFVLFALRALRALLRRDAPLDARVASCVAHACIAANPLLRKHAQLALGRLLYLVKVRTLSRSSLELVQETAVHPLKRCEHPANVDVHAYRAPLTDASHLRDKVPGGWLVRGATSPYYTPAPAHAPPLVWEAASDAARHAVQAALTPAWWDALAAHLAQEQERDYLSAEVTTFVKTLSQMYGVALLHDIVRVVDALVAARDRHKHRAAAELVGGLVRGAKHWPRDDAAQLWRYLDALFPRVLTTSTPDSQPAWQMCVEYVFKHRDPRRAQTLLAFVREHALARLNAPGASALEQAHAQQLLAGAVRALQRKCAAFPLDAVRAQLVANVAHDYQEVRRALAETLVELEYACAAPQLPHWDALRDAGRGTGSLLAEPPALRAECAQLARDLSAWRAARMPSAQGTSAYDRAAHTATVWMALRLDDHRLGAMGAQALDLLPDLFAMYQLRDNAELAASARTVLIQVASYPFAASHVAPLVDALLDVVRTATDSWHARLDALPLLQIVYFQNLFCLSPATVERVFARVLELLGDAHLEVREMAATTLAGLVRCEQRARVDALRTRFASEAAAHPLPPRGAPNPDGVVRPLHAALLGATALVRAFPYEVPAWVPPLLLDTIAPYSDAPVPIRTTVRACASDFRRTHQDNWAECLRVFGERAQELNDFTLGRSDYFV